MLLERQGDEPPVKKSKYRNKKVVIDGETFDSQAEGRRYQQLVMYQKAGVIDGLERQVVYRLEVNDSLICRYVADFVYKERGNHVIEDVKGVRTREYILKKKLMLAIHGIEIRETRMDERRARKP